MSTVESNVVVIYHASCWDGFCAAWLLWREFPDATLIPANYGDDPPNIINKTVYVVDFSYSREILKRMHEDAELLVVLDHHKTAKEALEGLPFCTFDTDKSGGRLTWEYIDQHIHKTGGGMVSPSHWLVDYTEDRDLWKWDLERSKEINEALRSYPLDFELWNQWSTSQYPPESLVIEGTAILRSNAATVSAKVRQSGKISLGGYPGRAANATTLMSETSQALADGTGFGLTWFEFPDGSRMYSLRSVRDSNVDVSAIAKSFGGGGHFNAAGFKLESGSEHPWVT